MNDFANRAQSNSPEARETVNMDDATWWKKQDSLPNSTSMASPLTPISYAFTNGSSDVFNFPASPQSGTPNNDDKTEKNEMSEKFELEAYSPTSSSTSSSTSSRKTLQMKDLLVVDDDEPSSSTDGYEPKAHLGWASFGESIQPPPKKSSPPDLNQGKRIRPQRERARPYHVINPIVSRNLKAPKATNKFPISKMKNMPSSKSGKESSDTDDDEIVDVVGIDEDEEAVRLAMESGNPPDLPPQRPLGSRFEMQRQKKGSPIDDVLEYQQRNYDTLDDLACKQSRSGSPPPRLEPQLSKVSNVTASPPTIKEDVQEELVPEDDVDRRISGFIEHDPTQMLKTKISSSAIPILPLSKSIMERKKAAIEMTKNAVIKRVPAPKNNTKNLTVAPKSVQVPAYADKTSITLYSNFNKPATVIYPRDNTRNCQRCRERGAVDMSNFKFLEDSNVIAVRAHLCDQTRVMIARTALFNREYARRLGDQSHGTIWQKPDEVTAQMTGFCSATVRRCIDIANLSIVPKCADRIGVSKNELTSLKTAFGEEKFCGQTMRTPHVLSQYYSIKAQSMAAAASTSPSCSTSKVSSKPKEKTPEDLRREEEEKKHHPLSYHVNTSLLPSIPPPVPVPKKTVLRWSSIQAPRILRAPVKTQVPVPKTTVIPVIKADKPSETVATHRRRGRPKKDRTDEPVRASRRLKLKKNNEAGDVIRQTVEFLVSTVSKKA